MDKERAIYLCATMDTKKEEAFFLKKEIELLGHRVALIDTGILKPSPEGVEVDRETVMGPYREEIGRAKTRSEASAYMIKGLQAVTRRLFQENRMEGMIAIGGSGGCTLASAAMRELPFGFPKVILTTMASGNTLPYLQGEDIILINPVVDIQNLNFFTRHGMRQAAQVIHGLTQTKMLCPSEKRAVAITGFGVTTPCVETCNRLLQKMGFEVLIFHARGSSGGRIMEKMIREGRFCGVLDVTTSELADEIAGGIYGVGPWRLRGAVEMGIPYVVVPGALEMINLSSEDTLQPWQRERVLYRHSPSSVKMRADRKEMEILGQLFAERLRPEKGMCSVLIPMKGFSSVNKEGGVFYDQEADTAFVETLKQNADTRLNVRCLDVHINDEEFGQAVVSELVSHLS